MQSHSLTVITVVTEIQKAVILITAFEISGNTTENNQNIITKNVDKPSSTRLDLTPSKRRNEWLFLPAYILIFKVTVLGRIMHQPIIQ